MARHTLLGVIGIGLQLISVAMVIAALATTMWTSWQTAGNNPSTVNMGLWKQCVTNSGVTSCVNLDCEKNYKSFANCKDVESAKGFGVTSVLVGFGALAVVSVFTFCKPTRGFALLSLILAVGTAALYIATLIAWAHFHKDLSSRLNEAKYEYSFIITVIAVILTSFASIISFLTCFKLGESRRDDHPLVTDDEAALKGGKAVAPAAWSEA